MNIDIYSATTYLPVTTVYSESEANELVSHDTDLFYFVPDIQEYIERLNFNYGEL